MDSTVTVSDGVIKVFSDMRIHESYARESKKKKCKEDNNILLEKGQKTLVGN